MNESASRPDRRDLSFGTLIPFLAIAFGLAWGLLALLIAFPTQIERWFGKITGTHPLFILAVWAPAIAAMSLVVKHQGRAGLASFLRRLTLWRMPGWWWAVLILAQPVLTYAGAAINGNLSDPFPFSPWYRVFPALLTTLVIGPVEELGWRGLAQPLLQRKFAPLWAGLLLGIIWAVWHLPAFLLSGSPQHSWSFGVFFLGVVAVSIVITGMFNASRGSILIPALFHFQANGPVWPDGRPWDTIGFMVIAVVVLWVDRRTMLSRDRGVTQVLMD
jgi:membrane protease YdiL (CAAX protease family)